MDMILIKRAILSSFFRKENLDEVRLNKKVLDIYIFI